MDKMILNNDCMWQLTDMFPLSLYGGAPGRSWYAALFAA
jgi:hypothetical protein